MPPTSWINKTNIDDDTHDDEEIIILPNCIYLEIQIDLCYWSGVSKVTPEWKMVTCQSLYSSKNKLK